MNSVELFDNDESAVEESCDPRVNSPTTLVTKCRSRMTSAHSMLSSQATAVTTTQTLTPFSSAQKCTRKTRQSATIFGLGNAITTKDSMLTGARLPTSRQVLRCLMFYVQEGASENRTKWQSAKLVLSMLVPFYEKANIPMISERKACERMNQLLEDNAKVRAIPCNRRSNAASLEKVKQMEDTLSKTFPLWPANAEKIIKNTEDLKFLQSMKGDRSATFGSFDTVLAAKIQRRRERDQSEAARRLKMVQMSTNTTKVRLSVSDTSSISDEADMSESDPNYPLSTGDEPSASTSKSHHRTVRTGTTISIPPDIIRRPKLVALATRLKMTPAQQAVYTHALIAEAGGDPSKVYSSYSTADKARRKVGSKIASTCRKQWIPPKFATLHWDSKLMPSLCNKNITEERLTVVVGNTHELKLLGVPSYQPGTDRKSGDIIADLTSDLLRTWHCVDSITNLTFDTTASNTGHISAACVTIQQRLNRALLWSACRHHVGEVILSHVFTDLQIEASKSPDITLFVRFRKNFELLPHEPLTRFNPIAYGDAALRLLEDWRTSILELAHSELSLCRDDYREFVELCTVFLNDEMPGRSGQSVTFKRPGALHKARWMAKLLYSIKICLFEKQIQQLPNGTVTTPHQVSKIRDFVTFCIFIYSRWWMTCNSAADAPWNDLQLYQNLLRYEAVNSLIFKSAIRAFKLHLWYLTEEMVPLALFSSKVPSEQRRALADKLLAVRPTTEQVTPLNRFGVGFGKPVFPSAVTLTTTLADLAGPDSWFIFHILQLRPEFLSNDVVDWPQHAAYQASAVNLQALNVINDCAERGVKLSSDFLSSAKGEKHYQNVLQVVEEDRKQMPDLRKRKRTGKQ